ncbi:MULTISPECIES: ABC transporter ATP-binding protein [unclassified Streptomyces]|uniref:ABC transporter ATP-binding protein n=1 Tax=unclassified Streptomyces TaxID=2593676 RepID=UPI00226DE9C9|nr:MULTISPECIES: ABC transporter ATP-binding protein [unclassified Streptomyces]MCY0918973.1 ABC transporter ATP-binding protein [Streptomyces sp. H27-G5]MCY0961263.1 ABC transporter ATP-binding protein [Streptomyces sp. H27-H5]
MTAAIEAHGLGRRFRRRGGWALRDCSLRLPAGRICALVGPNGAGKSTLLALAAGVLRPTEGTVRTPAREDIAYVAQGKPLYPQLTIGETLRMGADLNPGRWDAAAAGAVVEAGDLDPSRRVRALSGGQRSRVALALALGKRPALLLLDEPLSDVDPLARRELMGTLLATAGEHGTTVVMSSHILSELEDACDHLFLIDGGRVRLGGSVDDLLHAHTLVTGPVRDLGPHTVVTTRTTGRQLTALIRPRGPVGTGTDGWQAVEPTLEELLLAHLRAPDAPPLLTPAVEVAA